MSATALKVAAGLPRSSAMPPGRVLRAYLTEAKYECLRMLRAPSFGVIFLSLPVLLYLLFGVVLFGAVSAMTRRPLALFSRALPCLALWGRLCSATA